MVVCGGGGDGFQTQRTTDAGHDNSSGFVARDKETGGQGGRRDGSDVFGVADMFFDQKTGRGVPHTDFSITAPRRQEKGRGWVLRKGHARDFFSVATQVMDHFLIVHHDGGVFSGIGKQRAGGRTGRQSRRKKPVGGRGQGGTGFDHCRRRPFVAHSFAVFDFMQLRPWVHNQNTK